MAVSLAATRATKCLHRVERRALANERLNGRLPDAHEHVDALLLPDGRGYQRPATLEVGRLRPLQQGACVLVLRLHHVAEAQILQRVLVPAVDERVVRQGRQLADQRVVHLLRGALEEPATPGQEERVPDVGRGVARRRQAAHSQLPYLERIVLLDAVRQPVDAGVVATVHAQLAPILVLPEALVERLVSTGVVPVVVRRQYLVQLDALLLDHLQHPVRLDRIHHCGTARRITHHQNRKLRITTA
uniref:Uncharacterized protein n=1 Tax=Anopheles atroparvus TaxID=41427 RepID=A0A182JA71_ANOAO